jgi:hypothetical protein
MNILALVSSFRKQGNTARIVQLIEEQIRQPAAKARRALAGGEDRGER